MQLAGLELERVFEHPRAKPLDNDELALLAYIQRRDGVYFPPPARNPDVPLRYPAAPWTGKDIFNTRDVLNRRAKQIIADNAARSKSFASDVIFEIAKIHSAAGTAGLAQLPATVTRPVLTTQQPTRTIPIDAPPAPAQQMDFAKMIPWVLLGLSVVRTFK